MLRDRLKAAVKELLGLYLGTRGDEISESHKSTAPIVQPHVPTLCPTTSGV